MNLATELEVQLPWYLMIPGWVFPVVVLGIVTVGAYLRKRRRREQERQLAQAARTHGWHWEQTDQSLVDRWTLEPFGQGRRRTVRNVVFGEHRGWSFVAFDYHYTTGGGRSSRQHDQAVCVLTLPGTLPKIQAEPEGVFGGRVARAFGVGDLSLGDDELDRMWKVHTDDPEFGQELFHDRMRQLLRRTGGWTWGIEGDAMVSTYEGRLSAEELRDRLDLMATVIGEVPNGVWRTHGATA